MLERLGYECSCEVFVAESGEAGLKILETNPIDIVVSDLRLRVMNGQRFLRKVKERYPYTTRIILSEYASETTLIEGDIDGSNSLYLFKPWHDRELKTKISKLFAARELYHNPTLLELSGKLENLSQITGIYNSVCRLIEQDAEVSVITGFIETDPAVAASVLRIVNFGFLINYPGSINQSIAYLGLPIIKSIVLYSCILQSVQSLASPFTAPRMAQHAIKTNRIMAAIYTKVYEQRMPDSLATAGLLHNIGFVLFQRYYPAEYKKLLQEFLLTDAKKPLQALEKQTFGVTHSELGAYLLNWWGLPYSVVECALFHNNPTNASIIDPAAVMAIHLASNYSWNFILPELHQELDGEVFAKIGVTRQQFEKMLGIIMKSGT